MNGTSTATTYDNAGRIDVVQHKLGATILLALDYNYTADGLIDRIDETDGTGTYVLNYTYDKRGRLIAENRMSGTAALYSYSFTYGRKRGWGGKGDGSNYSSGSEKGMGRTPHR